MAPAQLQLMGYPVCQMVGLMGYPVCQMVGLVPSYPGSQVLLFQQ